MPELNIEVMAQLVRAVTGLAQFVQTLQQGSTPALVPVSALAPESVSHQALTLATVPPQAPVVVSGVPEVRTTLAMQEFYRLAPPTFCGQGTHTETFTVGAKRSRGADSGFITQGQPTYQRTAYSTPTGLAGRSSTMMSRTSLVCYRCRQPGHRVAECPQPRRTRGPSQTESQQQS